jgi:hypothetical protein
MVPQVIRDTLPDSKEAWRWGIGGVLSVSLISFFMLQSNDDKEFYQEQFLQKIDKAASERVTSADKLASALDKLGDNIGISTEVDRQMVDKLNALAAEQDDIGDEFRKSNSQFERFLLWAENIKNGSTREVMHRTTEAPNQ